MAIDTRSRSNRRAPPRLRSRPPAPAPRLSHAGDSGASRRLDIQGLRALAVLMVVAFHAGLPVPGGFVGVDVFFVISGFVITAMLQREWRATGRIRFRTFYLRRFKRLGPALAVVVVATTIVSSLVLSPLGPQQSAAETAAGAMLMGANLVVAGATAGYFDAPAELNPLLNTWSLSVEEQFYLGFPALLALGWFLARKARLLRSTAVAGVGLVAVVSFLLADAGTTGLGSSWLGFYSPFSRAWEFALGALLALGAARLAIRSRGLALVLGLLGAAMLAASLRSISGDTPFPGIWTLIPVVGTLLLLAVGTHTSSLVTRTLAARPLAAIGDWSYSIYLWHWPCIAFAAVLWPESSAAPVLAAALSLAPALASYRWVEQPIRKLPTLTRSRLAGLVAAVVVGPILVAAAVSAAATHFWTPRYESGAIAIANNGDLGQRDWHAYIRDHFHPCTPEQLRAKALHWEGIARCQQSQADANVSVAVIGDSHAEHLFLGLAEALPAENVVYYIRDDAPVTSDREFARIVEHVASADSVDTVVLSALWNLRGVRSAELATTLRTLSAAGKTVFVTDDVPAFPFDPFGCKYRKALFLPTECTMAAGRFERDYDLYYPELLATVRRVPGVHMVNTARYLCDQTACDMSRDGRLLYRDRTHLNIDGSRFVAGRILADHPELAAP